MEIIRIIVFEFLLGYGLQSFAIIFGIYVFNKQKIIFKNYILASVLATFLSYLVRLLPISFGVHTILDIIFLFLIGIIVLKMPAYPTIRSVLLVIVLLIICEMLNYVIMINLLGKEKFNSIMLNPLEKVILGFLASILLILLISLAYLILNNKKKKGGTSGNISA